MFRSIIAVVLVLTMSSWTAANAQWGFKQNQGNNNQNKNNDPKFQANHLDRPIALPGLPQYTGKQYFIMGLAYPNAKDGPGYIQTFNVEHTQDQVKQWWSNALRMSNWKITQSDGELIRAQDKDGSVCSITMSDVANTTKEKSKNCHSSYSIYFHQVKKR
jgi:hypothetical protein